MYAIEARGLVKSFGGVTAVDGLDLLVEEGDVVGLLGPNGAGKTTTLMMLLGITTPDAGTISLLGHPLPSQRVAALARTNFTASYVGMPDRIRVREVLDVFAGIYEVPRERIHAVVELFGLQPFEKRFATQLSSGQKTLLGLAKAMLNEPDLLILDEPTASLDPEVATRIRAALMEVHRERRFTLLITSHNMSEIERLSPLLDCDRALREREADNDLRLKRRGHLGPASGAGGHPVSAGRRDRRGPPPRR